MNDYYKELKKQKEENERYERVTNQIVQSCLNPSQQFSAWYIYLKSRLQFPFEGMWKNNDSKIEKVNILGMTDFNDCKDAGDMLVDIEYKGKVLLVVPLFEIIEVFTVEEATEAIEDWWYWYKVGDGFGEEDDYYYEDDDYD